MTNFSEYTALPTSLINRLTAQNLLTPTAIQSAVINKAIEGSDILATAQTGSGKTIAFLLPILTKLINDQKSNALILAPTRELANQVLSVVKQLVDGKLFKYALLIGGESIALQFRQLKLKPRLIIGTPGRVNDHLIRKTLNLSETNMFVLDEFDRMLSLGFGVQIEEIAKSLPSKRQTLMFSATLPAHILALTKEYLCQPVEHVTIGDSSQAATNIDQKFIYLNENEKYDHLTKTIASLTGSMIIFVKTKINADKLAKELSYQEHKAKAIHGDLFQSKRNRIIDSFRKKAFSILVATDVAARGLDINHIETVINYDLPHAPEDYIHRIGRTARGGAMGQSICFVSNDDRKKWFSIAKLMKLPNDTILFPANNNRSRSANNQYSKDNNLKSFRPRRSANEYGNQTDSRPRRSANEYGNQTDSRPRRSANEYGNQTDSRPRRSANEYDNQAEPKFKKSKLFDLNNQSASKQTVVSYKKQNTVKNYNSSSSIARNVADFKFNKKRHKDS